MHPRYINNLVCEMMQQNKLISKYETNINVKLNAQNYLSKILKENKKIRKRVTNS